ncbi:hypothetical protein [Shimia sp. MMG029]|uniref:hypothetical protein n=1 Tax=Shimia sp. MMG029 TaxID=3021978 RepID=UPI0022FE38AA|nr:hypothetical protein [Shimia sp. MMG029]MDA5556735.1 hypothetical protein [Shimia sp. MMG029]
MPNQVSRVVAKMDDLTLHQSLLRVLELLGPEGTPLELITRWDYSVAGVTSVGGQDVEEETLTGRYAFETANLDLETSGGDVFIVFRRRINPAGSASLVPSANFDQFDITFGDGRTNFEDAGIVEAVMQGLFENRSVPTDVRSGDVDIVAQQIAGFGAAHRQMLQDLHKQMSELAERRAEIEAELDVKKAENEKSLEEAMQALERERQKLELESYKARRRNLQSIITGKTAAQRRNEYVSKYARMFSLIVPMLGIAASVAGFTMSIQAVEQMGLNDFSISQAAAAMASEGVDLAQASDALRSSLTASTIYLMVKSILSSVVGVGGLLYAAGWFRRIYNSEVETAHELDRFNYDILRANWVIESVLEVTQEHDGEVPQEWLEGVTRGLFEAGEGKPSEDSGDLAMQALLGMSSSAKVGPDGVTLDLNKKNLRSIVKAAERAE